MKLIKYYIYSYLRIFIKNFKNFLILLKKEKILKSGKSYKNIRDTFFKETIHSQYNKLFIIFSFGSLLGNIVSFKLNIIEIFLQNTNNFQKYFQKYLQIYLYLF